jgi:hypothetical protein
VKGADKATGAADFASLAELARELAGAAISRARVASKADVSFRLLQGVIKQILAGPVE